VTARLADSPATSHLLQLLKASPGHPTDKINLG